MNKLRLTDLRYNLIVNLLDGSIFGLAMGFASYVTILPLFVSTLTDSPILIGMVPGIHALGWQLPQLLTAGVVSRKKRFKPMTLWMTTNERIPYTAFIFLAWAAPGLNKDTALAITFLLLIWQSIGAGLTATPWQSLIAKIFPPEGRGTFYGTQSAFANLLSSLSAVAAGFILERFAYPHNYMLNFILCSVFMWLSWYFLSRTREQEGVPFQTDQNRANFWKDLGGILRRDRNLRWFIVVRTLSPFAIMAFAFYTVYSVTKLGMSVFSVGWLTGVYTGTQIIANPLMGWLGDRWSHRSVMELGILSAAASALIAWWAPSPIWFILVFVLAGFGNVATWTVGLAMILEFGQEHERPAYIGLSNTLAAPSTILAPIFGGWIAQVGGYQNAFFVSALGALVTVGVLHLFVRDPRRLVLAGPEVRTENK